MAKSNEHFDGMKDSKFSLTNPWEASAPTTLKPVSNTDDEELDQAPVVYCSGWTPPSRDI